MDGMVGGGDDGSSPLCKGNMCMELWDQVTSLALVINIEQDALLTSPDVYIHFMGICMLHLALNWKQS